MKVVDLGYINRDWLGGHYKGYEFIAQTEEEGDRLKELSKKLEKLWKDYDQLKEGNSIRPPLFEMKILEGDSMLTRFARAEVIEEYAC